MGIQLVDATEKNPKRKYTRPKDKRFKRTQEGKLYFPIRYSNRPVIEGTLALDLKKSKEEINIDRVFPKKDHPVEVALRKNRNKEYTVAYPKKDKMLALTTKVHGRNYTCVFWRWKNYESLAYHNYDLIMQEMRNAIWIGLKKNDMSIDFLDRQLVTDAEWLRTSTSNLKDSYFLKVNFRLAQGRPIDWLRGVETMFRRFVKNHKELIMELAQNTVIDFLKMTREKEQAECKP